MTISQTGPLQAPATPEFTFADRLRKAREYAGLEQRELAAAIDIHRQTIAAYEKGSSRPRRHVVLAWAMATGVDRAWIEGNGAGFAAVGTLQSKSTGWGYHTPGIYPAIESHRVGPLQFVGSL